LNELVSLASAAYVDKQVLENAANALKKVRDLIIKRN